MTPSRTIEREFGVPIPGTILEPSRWAKTALKRLPPLGPIAWETIFGRRAPLVVDLGCGNGRFLLGSAVARPQCDHVGIDILPMVLRYATRRANQRGLGNIRFAAVDAERFVDDYLASGSVHEIHCYHPQPHHDRGRAGRRLLTPRFLAQVHAALEPGGRFFVQTDSAPYWEYVRQAAPSFFEFHEQHGPWPETPRGRTRREIIAARRGLPVHRGWGAPLPLTEAERAERVLMLPPPTFDAGPRRRDLDDLELETRRRK
jgi:tRNA (guanine-N7-)-methyltransferase